MKKLVIEQCLPFFSSLKGTNTNSVNWLEKDFYQEILTKTNLILIRSSQETLTNNIFLLVHAFFGDLFRFLCF